MYLTRLKIKSQILFVCPLIKNNNGTLVALKTYFNQLQKRNMVLLFFSPAQLSVIKTRCPILDTSSKYPLFSKINVKSGNNIIYATPCVDLLSEITIDRLGRVIRKYWNYLSRGTEIISNSSLLRSQPRDSWIFHRVRRQTDRSVCKGCIMLQVRLCLQYVHIIKFVLSLVHFNLGTASIHALTIIWN